MRPILAPRRAGANAAAAAVAALAVSLIAASGCTSGGASTLFPNDHRLTRAAEDVAAAGRPYGPIPRELQKQVLEAYYLQPGDILLLEVTDLEADIRLPADQTIMPDGTIDLGEYGRIVVAGLTIEQVESLVLSTVQAVEKDQQLKPINVRLNVAESAVYYVLGEVNSPGAYPLIGRETVLDALMASGGLSDRASDCEIILSRPTPPCSCRIVLPVCYDRIVQLGDTTTNYQIRPGDRVYVATRGLCEAIKFWRTDCPNCPSGACPCRDAVAPLNPPFVIEQQYPTTATPEPIVVPAPEPTPLKLPDTIVPEPPADTAVPTPPAPPEGAGTTTLQPMLSVIEGAGEPENPFLRR
jgi:protein involved in polysaccharide export with SLBB domain